MTAIPVILNDGSDILNVAASLRRGTGSISVVGAISLEVEDEITKAVAFAARLADLGEFQLPDLSRYDLRITFACRRSELPIVGTSYSLGLGVELLRLFSRRSWSDNFIYTGWLDADGQCQPIECIERKRSAAARAGYERIFLPNSQLDHFNTEIAQVPIESIFEAWSILTYGS